MHRDRPVRKTHNRLLLVFLLFSGVRVFSQSPVLVLPDLVAPKRSRPDIELPSDFPDPSISWYPASPQYRRLYRGSAIELLMPGASVPAPVYEDVEKEMISASEMFSDNDKLRFPSTAVRPEFEEQSWIVEAGE